MVHKARKKPKRLLSILPKNQCVHFNRAYNKVQEVLVVYNVRLAYEQVKADKRDIKAKKPFASL